MSRNYGPGSYGCHCTCIHYMRRARRADIRSILYERFSCVVPSFDEKVYRDNSMSLAACVSVAEPGVTSTFVLCVFRVHCTSILVRYASYCGHRETSTAGIDFTCPPVSSAHMALWWPRAPRKSGPLSKAHSHTT